MIVQGENQACKVKISDLVLGNENVDFYAQIEELVKKVNDLTTIIQTGSGDWSDTATTVSQNKNTWDNAGDVTNINTRLDAGESKWSDTSTAVELNSANWEATYNTVTIQKDNWQYAYDSVYTGEQNWNQAYAITLEGVGAIHEALEIIENSPWYETFNVSSTTNQQTPNMSQATASQIVQTWTALQLNENNWTGVYNTVKANSANWS